MAEKPIRIGIVGAGANTRARHIPGFRAIPGVEVRGVVNQTPESTSRAATELGIPKTYALWQELVADPEIDAVCIGTWPNLHAPVACAALEAGKHVLTEARMARNVVEARQMLAVAQAHPELVAQIVPSPFGLQSHKHVLRLLGRLFIGDLREVIVLGADDQFWDDSEILHWRQDREKSGMNVLTLGILHETLTRFVPHPTRVFAQTAIDAPVRPDPAGPGRLPVTIPESLFAITQLPGGARGMYHFSGNILFGPGKQIHLYGSHGTLKLTFGAQEQLWVGRHGDTSLQLIDVPEADRSGWRVEAEFIGAIRGEEKVQFTDFATGLKYMEFTEAVIRSAETKQPVDL